MFLEKGTTTKKRRQWALTKMTPYLFRLVSQRDRGFMTHRMRVLLLLITNLEK